MAAAAAAAAAELPRVDCMAQEAQEDWAAVYRQVVQCGSKSGTASDVHEERVRGDVERVRVRDPDLCVAVHEGWGGVTLMHKAARNARTEGLMRCVWECCGERALLLMRHRDSVGHTALLCLAQNPNMAQGMYAVFEKHCTKDDLRSTDIAGWSVLFHMALTFIHSAKTEEQDEGIATVMCNVVHRLGPAALDSDISEDSTYYDDDNDVEHQYPAGCTSRSILREAGDRGQALVRRLEEAATHHVEIGDTEEKEETSASTPGLAPKSAAAPEPAQTPAPGSTPAELPKVEDLSGERQAVCYGLKNQLLQCRSKDDAAHEANLETQVRALQESDPDLCVAVDGSGLSLMHLTALNARTEGLVRCVWECCGDRALQVMRHTTSGGLTVLVLLACNPDMTRGMYAVFAEHCTNDDLRAATANGWTVLFRMALTFIHDAKTEDQKEHIAYMMCAVVWRLGTAGLLAKTTKSSTYYWYNYPAASTPHSVLHNSGDKGRALLQRLEEAVAHPERATETGETAKEDSASTRVTPQSASAPEPAPTPAPASMLTESKQTPSAVP